MTVEHGYREGEKDIDLFHSRCVLLLLDTGDPVQPSHTTSRFGEKSRCNFRGMVEESDTNRKASRGRHDLWQIREAFSLRRYGLPDC